MSDVVVNTRPMFATALAFIVLLVSVTTVTPLFAADSQATNIEIYNLTVIPERIPVNEPFEFEVRYRVNEPVSAGKEFSSYSVFQNP